MSCGISDEDKKLIGCHRKDIHGQRGCNDKCDKYEIQECNESIYKRSAEMVAMAKTAAAADKDTLIARQNEQVAPNQTVEKTEVNVKEKKVGSTISVSEPKVQYTRRQLVIDALINATLERFPTLDSDNEYKKHALLGIVKNISKEIIKNERDFFEKILGGRRNVCIVPNVAKRTITQMYSSFSGTFIDCRILEEEKYLFIAADIIRKEVFRRLIKYNSTHECKIKFLSKKVIQCIDKEAYLIYYNSMKEGAQYMIEPFLSDIINEEKLREYIQCHVDVVMKEFENCELSK